VRTSAKKRRGRLRRQQASTSAVLQDIAEDEHEEGTDDEQPNHPIPFDMSDSEKVELEEEERIRRAQVGSNLLEMLCICTVCAKLVFLSPGIIFVSHQRLHDVMLSRGCGPGVAGTATGLAAGNVSQQKPCHGPLLHRPDKVAPVTSIHAAHA
jgi:hypothetical protein